MTTPTGTPAAILRLLRDGPQQAHELAETLGIDTSAVRRHLEGLREEGLVAAEDAIEGPGRPKKRYRLTPLGQEAFPRDYALLLNLLIGKLKAERGPEEAEALMARIAKDLGGPVAALPTDEARLAALVNLYNDLGFEARVERGPEGLTFAQRNCIFLRTARADPELLCQRLDEGIMRAALPGAKVEFLGSLATGALECRHALALKAARARRG